MTNHIALLHAAKAAISRVNADTTVSPEETKQSLEELREYIDELIDALDA